MKGWSLSPLQFPVTLWLLLFPARLLCSPLQICAGSAERSSKVTGLYLPPALGTPLPACMVTLSRFRHVQIVEGICTHCFLPQLTDLDHTFFSKYSPTRKSAVNLSALDHGNNGDTPKHFQEFHINLVFHFPGFLVIIII